MKNRRNIWVERFSEKIMHKRGDRKKDIKKNYPFWQEESIGASHDMVFMVRRGGNKNP